MAAVGACLRVRQIDASGRVGTGKAELIGLSSQDLQAGLMKIDSLFEDTFRVNLLSRRLGSASFVAILVAGLLAIAQFGNLAFAQTGTPTATGDTLVSGGQQTCAIVSGGLVECWGINTGGQLGNGTNTNKNTPVAVTGLTAPATALTAGPGHTCALLSTGGVECWGYNSDGQLGNGTNTTYKSTPVTVTGLSGSATALTAGGNHTCAILNTGDVECWGYNLFGQLGNGTNTNTNTPVTVTGLTASATALTAGGSHTCAILNTGDVECWGSNRFGQLGNGTNTNTNTNTPVAVTGLTASATALTTNEDHTCAILNTGQVKCWGYNLSGQLGNGTNTNTNTPVTVTGLTASATALTAGGNHTCAILNTGQAKCWGSNWLGQLGNGTTGIAESNPVPVIGLTTPTTALAAGLRHTCAILVAGHVKCWGYNLLGSLGDGTFDDRTTPVSVTGLSGPVIQPGGLLNPVEAEQSFTSLNIAPTISRVGEPATLTATIDPAAAAGAVAFTVDGHDLDPVQVVNGVAATEHTFTTTGEHPITATFTPTDTARYATSSGQATAAVQAEATRTQLTLDKVAMTAGGTVTATGTVTPAVAGGTVVFTVDGREQRIPLTNNGHAEATFQLDAADDYTIVATFEPGNPARYTTSTDQADIAVNTRPEEPPTDPPAGGSLASPVLLLLFGAFGS